MDVVRKATKTGIWSGAVKLARDQAVQLESQDDDEIVARVRSPGRAVAPTAVLYPGEREWDCDCGGRVMPCEHIAAVAIVLGQEPGEGGAAAQTQSDAPGDAAPAPRPPARAWGRIIYRLARADGGLRVSRAIVTDDKETPLASTLSAVLSRPADAASVSPEEVDLRADQLLGAGSRAALQPAKLDALLRLLAGCGRVLLDGLPVAVADDELLPRARVEDVGDDVRLTIEASPAIREVVSVGVALTADDGASDSLALQRLGELELTGTSLQHVPQVRTFAPRDLGTLAATVLPDLARRIEVDVRSRRLPRLVRDVAPRMVLDLTHAGEALSVLPTLVYGTPPFARVDEGRLVLVQPGGPVPVRDTAAERTLVLKLREELDLLPGRRTSFGGMDAPRFAEKLRRWRGGLTGDAASVVGETRRLTPRLQLSTAPAADGGPPHVTFDLRFEVESARGDAVGRDAPASVDAEAVAARVARRARARAARRAAAGRRCRRRGSRSTAQRVADLLAARDADGPPRDARAAATSVALCDDLDDPRPAGLDRARAALRGLRAPARSRAPARPDGDAARRTRRAASTG